MRPCGASSSARPSHARGARVASANTARLAPRGRQRVRRGAGFAARRRARRGVTLPNCLAPSSRRLLAMAACSATPSPMLRPGSSTHLRPIRGPSKNRSESRGRVDGHAWCDHLLRLERVPFGESELGVGNLAYGAELTLISVQRDSALFVGGSDFIEVNAVAPNSSEILPVLFLAGTCPDAVDGQAYTGQKKSTPVILARASMRSGAEARLLLCCKTFTQPEYALHIAVASAL